MQCGMHRCSDGNLAMARVLCRHRNLLDGIMAVGDGLAAHMQRSRVVV